MINKSSSKLFKLWFPFIINIFIILAITHTTSLLTMFICLRNGSFPSPYIGLTSTIVISILISTFFTFFIAFMIHQFIKPYLTTMVMKIYLCRYG